MRIEINDQYHFAEFMPFDQEACLEHLKAREIYDNTLRIPFPYTEQDFKTWIGIVEAATKEHGQPVHWAIRDQGGQLIGSLGFDGVTIGKPGAAEIGYWLARPFWGRGIMTAAVRRACQIALNQWKLFKITAHVFAGNRASARVLEKCGFAYQCLFKNHYFKDGQAIDARLYVLTATAD